MTDQEALRLKHRQYTVVSTEHPPAAPLLKTPNPMPHDWMDIACQRHVEGTLRPKSV